jgi:hypothetical protein
MTSNTKQVKDAQLIIKHYIERLNEHRKTKKIKINVLDPIIQQLTADEEEDNKRIDTWLLEKKKRRYWPDREKNRENRLIEKYNITVDQHRQMFISQNGKCAICHKRFIDKKDIRTDHNHITNQVRQLLCNGCNTGLGYFRENPQALRNAADYLENWNVNT